MTVRCTAWAFAFALLSVCVSVPHGLCGTLTQEQVFAIVSSLGEYGGSPLDDPRCKDAVAILKLINGYHYRGVQSHFEVVERLRRAAKNVLGFLELSPESNTAAAQAVLAKYFPAWMKGNNYELDCFFGGRLSEALRGEVNSQEAWDGLINAYLSELDPHSRLVSLKGAEKMTLFGEKVGIGITFGRNRYGELYIVSVTPGSPAERAGLGVGDELLSLYNQNGEFRLSDCDEDETVDEIMGPEGTNVELEIRKGSGKRLRLKLKREKFQVRYVDAIELAKGTLFIKIREFGRGSAEQVKAELQKYKNAQRVIVDVRSNPGGYIDEVAEILGAFLGEGPLLSMWDRNRQPVSGGLVTSRFAAPMTKAPLVVLQNDFSASASEILSQDISSRDSGRGVIVGRTSWGKGTVNAEYKLGEGRVLYLTQFMYFTIGGRSPHGKGVVPDIETFDREVAQVVEMRRRQVMMGHSIVPLREEKQPFSIPPPTALSSAEMAMLGIEVKIRPNLDLLAILTEKASKTDWIESADPTVGVAMGVLDELSTYCTAYQPQGCRTSESIVHQLMAAANFHR